MKVFLTDQSIYFPKHLEFLKQQPVMLYDKSELKEKITIISIDTDKNLHELDTNFFFDYKVFPSSILTFFTQWYSEKRQMKIGDTIVQQAFIPTFKIFSQKIIFGVRINEIISAPDKIGFGYETLEGHVEKGMSTFTIEKTADERTIFKVHTFSKPGNLLSKLAAPFFSLPYQVFCTRQALLNVKQQLEKQ